MLPARLNLIRRARLQFRFYKDFPRNSKVRQPGEHLLSPYDHEVWGQACSTLASMKGLEELYMHLDGEPVDPFGNTARVFESLCQIQQPRVFEVSVRLGEERIRHCTQNLGTIPFRVISRSCP